MKPVSFASYQRTLAFCLVLVFLFLSNIPHSFAQSVYKWVDGEGNVNYGERPPSLTSGEDMSVEKIETYSGSPNNSDSSSTQRSNAPARSTTQDLEKNLMEAKNRIEEQKKEMKANCKTAKKNLEVLTTHGRVKETDTDGSERFLTEDEHKSRVVQSTKFLEENCKGIDLSGD